ncbi:MAG: FkbM family methyltransferase [Candidatus Acidiferrales bacterium]
MSAFLELLEAHEIVLDIGANVGFYSCLAASRRKKVVSIEPSPRNLRFLYRNLWENQFRDTEVFPLGLAEKPGLNRLYGFGGIASFVPGWAQADKKRFSLVPITSLDTIAVGRFQGRKLLIKMDVEGFELDVLAGAKGILNLTPKPTWLIEVHLGGEAVPTGTNARFSEIFQQFWEHGYQCKKLNAQRQLVSAADVSRWISNGIVDDGTHDFLFLDAGGAPR